jgi:twitching motility protein PilJ
MSALASSIKHGTSKTVVILSALLVLFILVMVGSFVYTAIQDNYDKEYIALSAQKRLLSQRLATYALEAAGGKEQAFVFLKKLRDDFDNSLKKVQGGNPETGLPPAPDAVRPEFDALATEWVKYRNQINTILNGQDTISEVSEYVTYINDFIPQLLAFSDEVVGLYVKSNTAPDQVYIASRQLMLTQRIENNLNRVLAGGEGAATAADRFGRDAALFGRVLEGMIRGSDSMRINKAKSPEVINKLREVSMLFRSVSDLVGSILESSPQLFEIKDAASNAESLSAGVLKRATQLEEAFVDYNKRLFIWQIIGAIAGVAALGLMLVLGYTLFKDTRNSLAVTTEQNRRNQRAILRLLDEMSSLAEGDLTAHATVTEDITGAIADSVNYAIDALRTLVQTINQTSVRVSDAAEKTQTTAMQLADASNHQAREIASASAAITDMADSIEQVSQNAASSADVAQKSVDLSRKGAETVRLTIDGMDTIREQIQETSKRIKRLGESSQEIGDIVGLIDDIADQTNILALNAAIQASAAGEAGRGFAVVADEVQRLAERSVNATKQIEALVKTIQADTNEAVISMEQSTANVVAGAKLALDAGDALDEIEGVSHQLAELIQSISQSARQQTAVSVSVTNTMNVIQEITMQTSDGTNEVASSIGNMTDLANELQRSVSGFKLPESEVIETMIMSDEERDQMMETADAGGTLEDQEQVQAQAS